MTRRKEDWENYRTAKKAVKALELKVRSEMPARRPGWTKRVVIKLRG
jgi:hypothetical protein